MIDPCYRPSLQRCHPKAHPWVSADHGQTTAWQESVIPWLHHHTQGWKQVRYPSFRWLRLLQSAKRIQGQAQLSAPALLQANAQGDRCAHSISYINYTTPT